MAYWLIAVLNDLDIDKAPELLLVMSSEQSIFSQALRRSQAEREK